MQVTYLTLVNSVGSLNQLLNKQMDGLTAMRFSRAMTEIENHLKHWRAGRAKILENHGVTDEDLQNDNVDQETLGKLNEEIGHLLEEQVDISINPIDPEAVAGMENIEPVIFFNLQWLFQDAA